MDTKRQSERRAYLIRYLLSENPAYSDIRMPEGEAEQRALLRALMNVRLAGSIDPAFLEVQDEYLREVSRAKGIVALTELEAIRPDLYIWRGDITRLRVVAIVNAANSGMTGCYHQNHACIDNCIHTYAGIQLRLECAKIMDAHGYEEPTGRAKLTKAYNLPCDHVLHTVGPIVQGELTATHEAQLASCYRSCLELADRNGIGSIAFCCISTGVFMFPNRRAAEIAVKTVQTYKMQTGSGIRVIFNVFKEDDEAIYRELLK